MKNILGINLYNLPNLRHFWFHGSVLALLENYAGVAVKLASELLAEYRLRHNRVDTALKKIVKSPISQQLAEADRARDEMFLALTMTQGAACRHFAAAKKAAAVRVQVVFDTYGNVAKLPYLDETSGVYNLVQDLTSAKYVADVREAGLYDWVQELARLNNVFDALWKQRSEENGGKCDYNLKEERGALDDTYREIVKHITALMVLEGEAGYKEFVNNLNDTIAKYKVKSHKRGGKGGSEEEEDAETAEGGGEA